MRSWAALVFLIALASSARSQLKDAEFTVPAKPGEFNDKTIAFPKAPPVDPDKPQPPPPPTWTGGAEFGFNGAEGNSDVFNLRLGGLVKRQTDANIFNADLTYVLSTSNNSTNENKALFNVRDECLFKDSPWGVFASGQLEYDQFRAYDFRVASHTGFGYGFIKRDWISLRGRTGAGVSREVGGPNDRYVPEGLLGSDLFLAFSERQGLIGCVDYYPDLGRWGEYRVRARAAYQIVIDPDLGLTLRLGFQDRYDSNPGPAKNNDIGYFTTLLVKF
jgi:hypothetical protein